MIHHLGALSHHRRQLADNLQVPALRGIWKSIVDKYSDTAHFLLELIQNADDAEATECIFRLERDRFSFIHDGSVHFSVTDPALDGTPQMGHLNALTSIGGSLKDGVANKIGKFGIGFKSIFAYTDRVHIEDGDLVVDIVDYIVPIESKPIGVAHTPSQTVISFEIAKDTNTYDVIAERLRHLGQPTLNMRHLQCLMYEIADTDTDTELGRYSTSHRPLQRYTDDTELVQTIIESTIDGVTHTSRMLTVRQMYRLSSFTMPVELRLSLPQSKSIEPHVECFFPIAEESGTPYVMHAPFLLTNSRERVKWGETVNAELIRALAALQRYLYIGRQTASSLLTNLIMPSSHFRGEREKWRCFADEGKRILLEEPIYATDKGEKISLADAALTDDEGISAFFFAPSGRRWVETKSAVIAAVKNCKQALAYTFAEAMRQLPYRRDDLTAFYTFVAQHDLSQVEQEPIIKCRDGEWKAIRRQPSDACTSLAEEELDIEVRQSEAMMQRLRCEYGIKANRQLSIHDVYDFFARDISAYTDAAEAARLLTFAAKSYKSTMSSWDECRAIESTLRGLRCIPAQTIGSDEVTFAYPTEVYAPSDDVLQFLSGDRSAYIVSPTFVMQHILPEDRQIFYELTSAIGVSYTPLIRSFVVTDLSYIMAATDIADDMNRISLYDRRIVGFEQLVAHPTLDRSIAFARMLDKALSIYGAAEVNKSLQSKLQYYRIHGRTMLERDLSLSSALTSLLHSRWLISQSGEAISASSIESSLSLAIEYDQLSPSFFFFLGIAIERRESRTDRALHLLDEIERLGLSDDEALSILTTAKK